jgi:hypothetical protein
MVCRLARRAALLRALAALHSWQRQFQYQQSLRDQDVPRFGQASADRKDLGRRVDVIELQVLSGSAAHAGTAKHLDEASTSSLFPGLVVAALIRRPTFDHFVYRGKPNAVPGDDVPYIGSSGCRALVALHLSLGSTSPRSLRTGQPQGTETRSGNALVAGGGLEHGPEFGARGHAELGEELVQVGTDRPV